MEPAPSHDDADGGRPPEARTRRRSTLSVASALAFIVAVTTALALLSRETGQRAAGTAQPEESPSGSIVKGVSCPHLREAATLFAADDHEGFVAAIERAGREAEDALQRDGVVFGKPEQLALELSFLVTRDEGSSDARVRGLISRSVEACPSPG